MNIYERIHCKTCTRHCTSIEFIICQMIKGITIHTLNHQSPTLILSYYTYLLSNTLNLGITVICYTN